MHRFVIFRVLTGHPPSENRGTGLPFTHKKLHRVRNIVPRLSLLGYSYLRDSRCRRILIILPFFHQTVLLHGQQDFCSRRKRQSAWGKKVSLQPYTPYVFKYSTTSNNALQQPPCPMLYVLTVNPDLGSYRVVPVPRRESYSTRTRSTIQVQ